MKFQDLCTLFATLEQIFQDDPPLPLRLRKDKIFEKIDTWFRIHRNAIDTSEQTSFALLSAFFPERRSDRVYGFQPTSLSKTLGRCFLLGPSRQQELERWRQGVGDLGLCVERVLTATHSDAFVSDITLEEIDQALETLARRSRFSGPNVRGRGPRTNATAVDELFRGVYRRLQPQEAKIFTRMILKNYAPVEIPQYEILKCYHHLMPVLLKVYDNFEEAVKILRGAHLRHLVPMPDPHQRALQRELASLKISPKLGIKVGRPTFLKARGIKHALQLANGKIMSLERKYDGEYCQIHIDVKSVGREIRIFSKSGKDSTTDRYSVHGAIKECLRIGHPDCPITERCILEGEVLVWSDKEQRILDFHKVRKHISRSGSFLGTARDSQAHPWEHLMIVFFDAMLIDNENLLNQSYTQRRRRLSQIVRPIPGRVAIVEQETLNFSNSGAQGQLVLAVAAGFAKRWEGFVLKPCDDPYINFQDLTRGDYPSCWIKLKKDYIPGLGDTADLAIVGAGHDATASRNPKIRWTHLHIGCLLNRSDVLGHGAKPGFLVLDTLQWGIPESQMLVIQNRFLARSIPFVDPMAKDLFDLKFEPGIACNMDVIFRDPPVFEVLGSGFDKCPNRDYFQLRFPRLVKVHWDRDFKEAVDFATLQLLADKAVNAPPGDLREEVATFARKLELGAGSREVWPVPPDDSQPNDNHDDSDVEEVALIPQKPALVRTATAGVLPSKTSPRPPRQLPRSTTAPMKLPQEDPQLSKAARSLSTVSKKVIATTYLSPRETRTSATNRKRQREAESSQPESEPTPKRPFLSPSTNTQALSEQEASNLPLSEITNSAQRPRKRCTVGTSSPPKRQKMANASVKKAHIDLTESPAAVATNMLHSSASTTAFTSTVSTVPSSSEQVRKEANATYCSPPTSPLEGPPSLRKAGPTTTHDTSPSLRKLDVGVTMQITRLPPPITPILKRRNPWCSPAETTTASATESNPHRSAQEAMRVIRSLPPSSPSIRPASLRKAKGHNRQYSAISNPPLSSPKVHRLTERVLPLENRGRSTFSKPVIPPTHTKVPPPTQDIPPIFFLGTALPANLRKPQTDDSTTVIISKFSPANLLNYVSDQKVLILIDTSHPEATAKDLRGLIPMAQELGKIGRGIEIWDWGGEPLEGQWWTKSQKLGRRRRRIVGTMRASEEGEVRVEWVGELATSVVKLMDE